MSETDLISHTQLYDRLFEPSATKNYNLSIRFQPDGLSFSVFNPADKKFLGLEEVKFPIRTPLRSTILSDNIYATHCTRFLSNHPWLRLPFNKTNALFTVKQFTLVPEIIFIEENTTDYLALVHEILPGDKLYNSLCRWAEARLIFAVSRTIMEAANTFFPDARISHHMCALIETLLPRFKHSSFPSALFLNVRQGFSDILAIKNNGLVFVNTFECHSSEDSVYFLLFVMEQLQANPEQWPVFISGDVMENDQLSQLVYRYVRNVHFLDAMENGKTAFALEGMNKYRFVELLNPLL
ncbi:MAG: DUF3822 family protein [Lentimicrobiaceae bacterium]|nr:DUF3822 family protein [Lentimicrobiaceae bacterium]